MLNSSGWGVGDGGGGNGISGATFSCSKILTYRLSLELKEGFQKVCKVKKFTLLT